MKNVKNKLVSVSFILTGVIATLMSKDATVLVFTLMIGIPVFFSKENVIR